MANTGTLHKTTTPLQTYGVLLTGIVATSLAAIFIRLAQNAEIPSLVIAASRLGIATLILTPFTLRRYSEDIRALARRDFLLIGLSGAFLAVHFITWISSLEYASVLVSSVLVSTSPLWIAGLEFAFLKLRPSRAVIIGLLAAVAGGVIIGFPAGDAPVPLGSNPLLGGVLALCGAGSLAVYLVVGRGIRPKLPLLPYIWMVYGSGALIAFTVVLLSRTQVAGYEPEGYLWVFAVALIPQLIGHSSFNYTLKHLSATFVGIAGQLEPAASALMAVFVFNEVPHEMQIIGSGLMLVGVILAITGQEAQA